MNKTSERAQVRTVAARWKSNYYHGPVRGWSRCVSSVGVGGDTEKTYQRLLALDVESATAEDVKAIIGNSSWVSPTECDECGLPGWNCVTLGEEPDFESATADICPVCLRKALALAEEP